MQETIGLLIFALIISVGFFADWIFQRTKFPDIIWLLFIGLLLGPIASIYGYDIVSREALKAIAPIFSAIALMTILFEGGLGMDIHKLMKEAAPATVLTTVGVALSTLVIGGLFYLYSFFAGLGVTIMGAMILGLIVSGTSSAIVIPTMSRIKGIKPRPSLILSLESILTDPIVIIITLVLIEASIASTTSIGMVFGDIFSSFAISIVMGIMAGMIWTKILPKLNKYEFHHMLTIAYLLIFYTLGELIGASGAIVSFTIGVMIGNSKKIMEMLKLKNIVGLTPQTRKFNSLISFLIRTFFFVFIGTLVTFETPLLFLVGIVIGFMLLGIRWVMLRAMKPKLGMDEREQYIMLFMYPRGLAAAVLASLPAAAGIAGAGTFTEIVFSVILTTILISTFGILTIDRKYPIKKSEKV